MNISNIVHGSKRDQQASASARTNAALVGPHERLLQEYRTDMASTLNAGPYVNQSPVYTRSPQPPPSPPSDDLDSARTLPSIRTLISMDGQSAGAQPRGMDAHPQSVSGGEKQPDGHRPPAYGQPSVSNPENRPPSPPIDPLLGFDTKVQSPSTTSSHSSQLAGVAAAKVEPSSSRQAARGPTRRGGQSPPSTSASYPYSEPAVPGAPATYPQRPLPASFSPANATQQSNSQNTAAPDSSPTDSSAPNQWQHHHYIAPSTSATFPGQTQDRYICQVCNKAFSRPSSLRIHSHSHTGEKPFLCPHKGCGKAFSVRSNMKRHERGCHGGNGEVAGDGSPGSNQ